MGETAVVERKPFITRLYQDFEVIETIGEGGFGQVYKVKRKSDGRYFAVKVVKILKEKYARKIRREAESLASLNHQNVVRYFNSWIERADLQNDEYERIVKNCHELSSEIKKYSDNGYMQAYNSSDTETDDPEDAFDYYADPDSIVEFRRSTSSQITEEARPKLKTIYFLYIHMELCDKTLRDLIDDNIYLQEDELQKCFKEICEGLSHVHDNGIVHRDLKPENIFVLNNVMKIGDFGLSRYIGSEVESDDQSSKYSLTANCGTSLYKAPEVIVLDNKTQYTLKVDMYSIGIILFEMCNEPMTFHEKCNLLLQVRSIKRIPKENLPPTTLLRSIFRALTSPDPEKRPTCQDLLRQLNFIKPEQILQVINDRKLTRNREFNFIDVEPLVKIKIHNILKEAIQVFQLHGGIYISMQTFLTQHTSSNAEMMINKDGETLSLSHDSRIVFAKYVVKNFVQLMRRYSTDKVFIQNPNCSSLPEEIQECSFDIVSPDAGNHINDVEIIQIAFEILEKIKICASNNIRCYINHRYLFETIVREYGVLNKNRKIFCNILTAAASNLLPRKEFAHRLGSLGLRGKRLQNILNLYVPKPCKTFSINSLQFKDKLFHKAESELEEILIYLEKFGMDLNKIFIAPLLLSPTLSYSGMICQFIVKDTFNKWHPVASGGRYDKHVSKDNDSKDRTAVGISLNVYSMLKAMENREKVMNVCAIISTDNEYNIAISLLLRRNNISCFISTHFPDTCRIVIVPGDNNHVSVYDQSYGLPNNIFSGSYTDAFLISLLKPILDLHSTKTTTFQRRKSHMKPYN